VRKLAEEVTRRDYDKVAGGVLMLFGVLVALIGGSLLFYEQWRHALGARAPTFGGQRKLQVHRNSWNI